MRRVLHQVDIFAKICSFAGDVSFEYADVAHELFVFFAVVIYFDVWVSRAVETLLIKYLLLLPRLIGHLDDLAVPVNLVRHNRGVFLAQGAVEFLLPLNIVAVRDTLEELFLEIILKFVLQQLLIRLHRLLPALIADHVAAIQDAWQSLLVVEGVGAESAALSIVLHVLAFSDLVSRIIQ